MADFDIKIWLRKWGFGLGATLLSTGMIFTADYLGVNAFPPEYAFYGGLLITFLNQIGNYIKHKYLETT